MKKPKRQNSSSKSEKLVSVAPIYAVAITWLVLTLIFPPVSVSRALFITLASIIAFLSVNTYEKQKYGDAGDAADQQFDQVVGEEEARAAADISGSDASLTPEVRAIIAEGQRAQKELGRLYASIPDAQVKRKIRDIMEISDKIIQDAREDPTDVPQIKKFLDYYLPTTIKLLNAYDRMGQQGIEGENISGTMTRIEDMLDTAIDSYRKLLDGLFANQAMDIETDISVMNTMLKREGLAGDDPFAGARTGSH